MNVVELGLLSQLGFIEIQEFVIQKQGLGLQNWACYGSKSHVTLDFHYWDCIHAGHDWTLVLMNRLLRIDGNMYIFFFF